jgi:hypothetical protein
MSYSIHKLRDAVVASACYAVVAAGVAACSSPSAGPSGLTPAVAGSGAALHHGTSGNYSFQTINNPNDPNTTVLTGINNLDKLVGYYGTGKSRRPYSGFIVYEPYGAKNFKKANYPGAYETQVAALNNKKSIAGYFVDSVHHSWIFGFTESGGIWTEYKDPKLRGGSSNVTELLGLNDAGLAVGFYTDDKGTNHAFELNPSIGKYHGIFPPSLLSVKATGINGKGDICGYGTIASGATVSWLLKGGGFTIFAHVGSADTEALGVNWQDQVVGRYVDLTGNTHGFILSNPLTTQTWETIDEPDANGTTVVTSIEDHRNLVGYYVDSSGNTNGFLGTYK